MRITKKVKKAFAIGLSAAMFSSSIGVWAESLENSANEQETVAEEFEMTGELEH